MDTQDRSTSRQFVGRYICIDPGLDTGFSLLEVPEDNGPVKLIDYNTIRYDAAQIRKNLFELYYYDIPPDAPLKDYIGLNTVILEKFVHRPGRPFEPTAYKVMGIAECWHQDCKQGSDPTFEYIERVPVQGKSEAPDDVLKRLGVFVKRHENRHINDATRHGVSWLMEKGHIATCEIARPKDKDE